MYDDRIFIKGNKDGITAIVKMDNFKDFDEMLDNLLERLNVGKQFYKGATMTLTTSLKFINERQMRRLRDTLFEQILIKDCIFKDKDEKESRTFTGIYEGRTKFLRRAVRSGQVIKYNGNVVIIGDVNSGAEIHAAGNIIVLGTIKGQVYAGTSGNNKVVISAFSLQPEILKICDTLTISPDDYEKPKYPEVAKLKDGTIIVEPYLPNKYIY